MFRLALLLALCALVSALCGFGWFLDLSFLAGRLLCGVFLVLAAVTLLAGLTESGAFGDRRLQRP